MNMRVSIIGAGSCGLYIAWKLAERGHIVQVFEKREKIGNEVCSGLFSQRIIDFIPESKTLIQNTIGSARLHFPRKTIGLRFSKKFYVMSHFDLDRLLASLATQAGARIFLKHPENSIPSEADRVIGCDGSFSMVRGILQLPDPNFRSGIQCFVPTKDTSDFVDVWPCKSGFLWKIPRSDEVEYGIMAKPEIARALFEEFLQKEQIHPKELKAKIIPQSLIIPRHSHITLCGNAAGLTKPWSGGGVIWGLTAAQMLIDSFPDFKQYRKKVRRFFIPKIILSKIATKLVYLFGFHTPWLLPGKVAIESDFLL